MGLVNKILLYAFITLSAAGLCSCEGSSGSSQSTLPVARGASGEILLVMDSTAWRGPLGDEIRLTFMESLPGLPLPEPYFDLRYVNPLKLNSVLRSAKNMVFVTTLENQSAAGQKMRSYFTPNSIERIRQEPDLYMLEKPDEYAQGQMVLHLFGTDQPSLIGNIRENREQIRQYFVDITRKQLKRDLYTANEQRSLEQQLLKEHDFAVRVPFGYDRVPLGDTVQNFVWLRQLGDIDKSLVIAYEDYATEDAFSSENILALRQRHLGRYVTDGEVAAMTWQREAPVVFDTVTFQGKFAVETRGRWKMSNNSMGGAFVSYTFVDEAQNRLYYLEGFVYRPTEKQRKFVRELETIMRTFRTPAESKTTAAIN